MNAGGCSMTNNIHYVASVALRAWCGAALQLCSVYSTIVCNIDVQMVQAKQGCLD